MLDDMMKPFASPEIAAKMFQPTKNPLSNVEKSVVHFGHDWQVQQTRGEGLNALNQKVLKFLSNNLNLHKIESAFSVSGPSKSSLPAISCKRWAVHTLIDAIQTAYFGEALSAMEPELVEALVGFDNYSWRMFNRYPKFMTREMDRNKSKIIETLEKYFDLPREQRTGQSWFMRTLEDQYRALNFSSYDMAKLVMFTYWG